VLDGAALGVDPSSVGQAAAKVQRVDYFVPVAGAGAEMLQGGTKEVAAQLVELLKAKGGLN
jgi:electron transfer flavoprotein beta subunit